jgi:cyclase
MKYSWAFIMYLLVMPPAFAQPKPPEVAQVSERLYVITGLGGNVAFLVTEDGVLVVDAGNSPADGLTIIRKIREKTDKPIKYLVITHYHGDHTNGMQAFPQETQIIGQKNLIPTLHERKEVSLKESIEKRIPANIEKLEKKVAELRAMNDSALQQGEKNLLQEKQRLEDAKKMKIVEPNNTFDDSYRIILDKDTVDLQYPGPAHTKCNIVVLFRSQKILQTGDVVFNGSFPYIIWQDGSDTKNWAAFLRKMIDLWQVDKIIPGHGGVTAPKENILRLAEYLTDLRAEVDSAMKKGNTLEEMKKNLVFRQYADFQLQQILPVNIESVYHELGGK